MSNEAIVNALLAKENVGHPMDSIDTFADELSAVTAERLMPDARLCAAGARRWRWSGTTRWPGPL
jgi:hypothetical protein